MCQSSHLLLQRDAHTPVLKTNFCICYEVGFCLLHCRHPPVINIARFSKMIARKLRRKMKLSDEANVIVPQLL